MHGSMSQNEQAMTLLAGFASSSVKMDGDSLKHLFTIPERSINDTLNEIQWETTKTKEEHEKEEKLCKQKKQAKTAATRAKKLAAATKATQNPTAAKPQKTNPLRGKAPHKQLATKAA